MTALRAQFTATPVCLIEAVSLLRAQLYAASGGAVHKWGIPRTTKQSDDGGMHYSADLFHSQFANRIKTMRKEHGWSERDMIVKHGFQDDAWQALEKGSDVTVPAMLRLCEVFGVTMPELVAGVGERTSRAFRTTSHTA